MRSAYVVQYGSGTVPTARPRAASHPGPEVTQAVSRPWLSRICQVRQVDCGAVSMGAR
ncbi:Hypothetical protein SCLAV_0247 [Streptomyces clavuligerus]|uniref:Uncharacterized protein n=1 Tax=Streptomyces clavuligerus TaxID=1901 RepID=E2Q776_STRCL|nr:Hypothetical protein SCLAV_0247 [Streptomyces clavuligerus]